MRGYELTDRGKIIIAVLLVILVLVIPSVIISINAWVRDSPQDESPDTTEATPQPIEDPSDGIAEPQLPPPDGGLSVVGEQDNEEPVNGYEADDAIEEGNGASADTSDSSSDDTQHDLQERGVVGLNVAEGTMAFIFFPGAQTELDEETASLLGEFLASPRNTVNSRIMVELPQLSEEDRLSVINAVISELTGHGVSISDIVFFTTDEVFEGISFEIHLSFHTTAAVTPAPGGK